MAAASAVGSVSRRSVLASSLGLSLGALTGCAWGDAVASSAGVGADTEAAAVAVPTGWRVPAETTRHRRTWMAWPSSRAIWGRQLEGVQGDVALVAQTIARYEPVVMCAWGARQAALARQRCGRAVTVIGDIPVDDCWLRDTGPVFGLDAAGRLGAVGLGFNGWGGKQRHMRDRFVARGVANRVGAPFRRAGVVGEGGGVESDGDGTLLATESSWLGRSRNPGMTRDQIERELLRQYGAETMIWAPGVRGHDITDDHIDSTSRFARPGVVLVQVPPAWRTDRWARDARQQHRILSQSTDARGRRLEVVDVPGPSRLRVSNVSFLDSYVNFALPRGAVITAQFGDHRTDAACREVLAAAFPDRDVVQLDVDRLHRGGGGIHCITQQQPHAVP